jgi:hypothetical protein
MRPQASSGRLQQLQFDPRAGEGLRQQSWGARATCAKLGHIPSIDCSEKLLRDLLARLQLAQLSFAFWGGTRKMYHVLQSCTARQLTMLVAIALGSAGGGLVPNLISGNVEAVVLYSPLSFKMMLEKQGRSLLDYGSEVEPHLSGLWIATDKFIADKPAVLQKALNAIYGAVAFLKSNRAEAVKMIAEIDEIPPQVAEAELDGNISKLLAAGEIKAEWMSRALDLARLIGMTDLAPVQETFVTNFKPVPTAN